jgi:hypothetical protein
LFPTSDIRCREQQNHYENSATCAFRVLLKASACCKCAETAGHGACTLCVVRVTVLKCAKMSTYAHFCFVCLSSFYFYFFNFIFCVAVDETPVKRIIPQSIGNLLCCKSPIPIEVKLVEQIQKRIMVQVFRNTSLALPNLHAWPNLHAGAACTKDMESTSFTQGRSLFSACVPSRRSLAGRELCRLILAELAWVAELAAPRPDSALGSQLAYTS